MNVVPIDSIAPLERRAKRIRDLMADMVNNTLAIGEELDKARDTFPIGPKNKRMHWKTWLRDEFKFSEAWATRLILIHRKFGALANASATMPSVRVLDYLVKEKVPESGRQDVLDRVAKGEKITLKRAKKIVAKRLPSPKKANKMAKETGKPVPASDGYVYLGATAEDVMKSTERRTVVYAVREAIERIAALKLTAEEFLEYAAPHQLWKAREEHQIEEALEWLQALAEAWPKRRNEIRK